MTNLKVRPWLHAGAVCGLSAVFFCAFAPVQAATQLNLENPTAISVGGYWPTSDRASHNGGSTQLVGEVRYTIPDLSIPGVESRTALSAGVEFGADHGGHSTIVPVTIAEYFGGNNESPLDTQNFYFGGGIGVYFLNQSGISTTTDFGGFVALGYNFTTSIFGEAKYQFVSGGDGPLVQVGLRF